MAVQSRKDAISKGTDGTYHAASRCLEHTVLDGIHPASGKKATHRRGWIAQRVEDLQSVFAVRVLAVTVRERRVDLVITCLPEVAGKWSAEEVVWRWTSLFGHGFGILDRNRFSELAAKKSLVAEWRKRLTSVSWFMRGFNEWLARRINKEEERKGQFWDGRFNCGKVGKADIADLVAGLEGHRIAIPAARKSVLFPGIKALPEAAAPAKRQARAKNGRFVYHPNDIHALAEKTFGRKLYHHPFEEFCRELRNS